jgi:hypothetical protein
MAMVGLIVIGMRSTNPKVFREESIRPQAGLKIAKAQEGERQVIVVHGHIPVLFAYDEIHNQKTHRRVLPSKDTNHLGNSSQYDTIRHSSFRIRGGEIDK